MLKLLTANQHYILGDYNLEELRLPGRCGGGILGCERIHGTKRTKIVLIWKYWKVPATEETGIVWSRVCGFLQRHDKPQFMLDDRPAYLVLIGAIRARSKLTPGYFCEPSFDCLPMLLLRFLIGVSIAVPTIAKWKYKDEDYEDGKLIKYSTRKVFSLSFSMANSRSKYSSILLTLRWIQRWRFAPLFTWKQFSRRQMYSTWPYRLYGSKSYVRLFQGNQWLSLLLWCSSRS